MVHSGCYELCVVGGAGLRLVRVPALHRRLLLPGLPRGVDPLAHLHGGFHGGARPASYVVQLERKKFGALILLHQVTETISGLRRGRVCLVRAIRRYRSGRVCGVRTIRGGRVCGVRAVRRYRGVRVCRVCAVFSSRCLVVWLGGGQNSGRFTLHYVFDHFE